MALYKFNTGCREQEVCQLRWEWEVQIPELETSLFILPSNDQFETKNSQEHVVLLNLIARRVVNEQRGKSKEFVFTFRGRKFLRIHNWGWKLARDRAGLSNVRVHDLRHTFGHRLLAAGVSFEERQDFLGHKSALITIHFLAPIIARLL